MQWGGRRGISVRKWKYFSFSSLHIMLPCDIKAADHVRK